MSDKDISPGPAPLATWQPVQTARPG